MDLMDFLYRVMEELSNEGVPVVFKGAMVLNLAIRKNNPSNVERLTRDIDGDWIGDYERYNENNEYKECSYINKDDVNECIDYFMGECLNSCSFCPLEDRYGQEY